jgi:hypothetical protein
VIEVAGERIRRWRCRRCRRSAVIPYNQKEL